MANQPSIAKTSNFIIDPQTTYSESIDTLYMLLAQADAGLVCLMGSTHDCKEFYLDYTTIINLLWGIQQQVEAANTTLNHLVKLQQGGNHE